MSDHAREPAPDQAPGLDRRQFLGGCAVLAAGAVCTGAAARPRRDELDAVVAWLVAEPRAAAVARAASLLRQGPCHELLVEAVGVAAAQAIRSDLPTFNHVALATHSVRQLLARAGAQACDRRVLWLVDKLKQDQGDGNGWQQASLPAATPARPAAAAALALQRAIDDWQPDAAEEAVVDHAAAAGAPATFALLRPYGMRCQANLGHKAIYAAATDDMLLRLPAPQQTVWLRSFARSLFIHGRGEMAATFAGASRSAGELAGRRGAAATGDDAAQALLAAIRTGDPAAAVERAAAQRRGGAAPGALWDAVFLGAAELVLAEPGYGPLHAITSAVALAGMARAATVAAERELALLQAASWQAGFRRSRDGVRIPDFRLEEVAAAPPGAGDSLLARTVNAAAEPRVVCYARVLGLDAAARARLAAEHADYVMADAVDVHHVKLGAAVGEILPQVGPAAGAALLAAALQHLPPLHDPAGAAVRRRLDAALRSAK